MVEMTEQGIRLPLQSAKTAHCYHEASTLFQAAIFLAV